MEKVRREKMQVREKVGKSRNTVFFQCFVAPEGRKVGSLKRRVRDIWADEKWKIARRCGAKHILKSKVSKHTILGRLLEVEMWKKCTLLWREAHFDEKSVKTPQGRTTFGSADVEKVRPVVARSKFLVKMLKLPHARATFGFPYVVQLSKKCALLRREAHFEVKSVKTPGVRTTFWWFDGDSMWKECTPLWREAHLEVKSVKNCGFWATFEVSDVVLLTDKWI